MENDQSSRRGFLKAALRYGTAGGLFVMTGLFVKRGAHDHPGECSPDLCGSCLHRDRCRPEAAGSPGTGQAGKGPEPADDQDFARPEAEPALPDTDGNAHKQEASGKDEEEGTDGGTR